jgi:uracil-DNA glycosylase family 4
VRGPVAFDISPPRECAACPRLAEYRAANRSLYPEWSNAPVASFGEASARLMIVGLAPGLKGANRTGRPFTGDYAGDLLYETLIRFGFAVGVYGRRPDDGLELVDCAIVNAVRCAPPQNKPTPQEIAACRAYLAQSIGALANLKIVLALGRVAHDSLVRAFGARAADFPFAHGARHVLKAQGPRLFDSYHCSRYNTNTGVLTEAMFRNVFASIRAEFERC